MNNLREEESDDLIMGQPTPDVMLCFQIVGHCYSNCEYLDLLLNFNMFRLQSFNQLTGKYLWMKLVLAIYERVIHDFHNGGPRAKPGSSGVKTRPERPASRRVSCCLQHKHGHKHWKWRVHRTIQAIQMRFLLRKTIFPALLYFSTQSLSRITQRLQSFQLLDGERRWRRCQCSRDCKWITTCWSPGKPLVILIITPSRRGW